MNEHEEQKKNVTNMWATHINKNLYQTGCTSWEINKQNSHLPGKTCKLNKACMCFACNKKW